MSSPRSMPFSRLNPRRLPLVALAGILSVVADSGCSLIGDRPLTTLTRVEQVRSLDAGEANRGYPVRIRGVITFYDPNYYVLTVQDATAGVALDARSIPSLDLREGMLLDVEGWTGFDGFATIIVKPRINILEGMILPPALAVTFNDIFDGRYDFQRVEVKATVTGIKNLEKAHVLLLLTSQGQTIEVYLRTEIYLNPALHGREITVRGVPYTIHDSLGNVRKARIYVSDYRDLDVKGIEMASIPEIASNGKRPDRVLTSAQEIKALTSKQAESGFPVKLRAIVNFYQPSFGGLFLQDQTAGIYANVTDPAGQPIAVGSLVEIEGRTDPGAFAPSIAEGVVRLIGTGSPYPPLRVRNPDALAMKDENLRAVVSGTVRRITNWREYGVQIEMAVSGHPFSVLLSGDEHPESYSDWLDSEREFLGVLSPLYDRFRHMRAFILMCPGVEHTRRIMDAPTFAAMGPPNPLVRLQQFELKDSGGHRVKVAGAVTGVWRDSTVTITDGSYDLDMRVDQNVGLEVGDTVEAVGFPPLGGFEPALEDVQLRKTGHQKPVAPTDLDAAEAVSGIAPARLIRVEGVLTNQERILGDEMLTLKSGKTEFAAVAEQPQPSPRLSGLRRGSLLRLTGVCQMEWDRSRNPPEPRGFRLRLRSPQDVEVLQIASWWTPGRTLTAVAGLAAVLIASLGWAVSLRNQVRRQTGVIAARAEEAAQLEAQLAHVQRLESVGRLAGGIAHDFNNLLTVVNGYCELLLAQPGLSRTLKLGLEEIAKAGKRAATLTQQILAFSRRQVLQPVVLDLNDVVRDMHAMLRRVLGEQIEFVTTLDPDLGLVKADPGQMQQVLMNLAVNARDAMPSGGTLAVMTTNTEVDKAVRQSEEEVGPGPFVCLAVSDTGSGMDAQTLERIYEPFFTTKPAGMGTGLGLSTVFGIVRQSGGYIQVQSEPGKGSRFEISLPRISNGAPGASHRNG